MQFTGIPWCGIGGLGIKKLPRRSMVRSWELGNKITSIKFELHDLIGVEKKNKNTTHRNSKAQIGATEQNYGSASAYGDKNTRFQPSMVCEVGDWELKLIQPMVWCGVGNKIKTTM